MTTSSIWDNGLRVTPDQRLSPEGAKARLEALQHLIREQQEYLQALKRREHQLKLIIGV